MPPQVHLSRRAEEFGEDRVQLTADLVSATRTFGD
jgi:hypothetical protein